jgi:transposase
VRATRRQLDQLLGWAEPFEKRTWAIESAGGLGYLLAQQLVARGEEVLDIPATLASRSGRSNKNDPNDALSIAIAAFRAPNLRSVEPADHAQVIRLLSKRNMDLGSYRTEWSAASMPSWPNWLRAESPKKCTFPTPSG